MFFDEQTICIVYSFKYSDAPIHSLAIRIVDSEKEDPTLTVPPPKIQNILFVQLV